MKININGVVREATQKEIEEMKQLAALIPQPVKSEIEERLEKLESLFEKVVSLLGVKVE